MILKSLNSDHLIVFYNNVSNNLGRNRCEIKQIYRDIHIQNALKSPCRSMS